MDRPKRVQARELGSSLDVKNQWASCHKVATLIMVQWALNNLTFERKIMIHEILISIILQHH